MSIFLVCLVLSQLLMTRADGAVSHLPNNIRAVTTRNQMKPLNSVCFPDHRNTAYWICFDLRKLQSLVRALSYNHKGKLYTKANSYIIVHVLDTSNATQSHWLHLMLTSVNKVLKVIRKYLFLFVMHKSMAVDGNIFAAECAFRRVDVALSDMV